MQLCFQNHICWFSVATLDKRQLMTFGVLVLRRHHSPGLNLIAAEKVRKLGYIIRQLYARLEVPLE